MAANAHNPDVDRAGAQARDKLVAAAGDCIDRGEISETTVGALAKAAGVHRVTFYRHFQDMESLLAEVLERRAAPVLEHAAERMESGDFFPDGLIDAMATAISEVRQKPGLAAALGLYPTHDVPRSAATSDRFLQRAVDITGPHLEAAQATGLLRNDVPVNEIMEWLIQVCLANVLLKPHDSLEDARRQLCRFVVPAIRAK